MHIKPSYRIADLDFRTWVTLHPHHGGGGVYVVCDAVGKILYIGSTNDLQRRMRAHWRQYGFSLGRHVIYWRQVLAPIEAVALEYWLIRKHKPSMNRKGFGKQAAELADWFYEDFVIPSA